jgi:transforming growth factor-beta-induced protein
MVGEEMLKKLANNSDLLFAVLTYHVVPGLIPLNDLSVGGVKTFDGRFATISSFDPPMINGVDIVKADVFASNGIIHVINEVLIPPETIAGILIASSESDTFSTLVSLLRSAGLVDILNSAGPLTVFAPTNDAFDMVGEEMLKKLANNSDLLFAVLTYHVVPGLIPLNDLSLGDLLHTFDGRFATISSVDPPMINGVDIVKAELFASNGIIHVIKEVLIPPGTIADTASPDIAGSDADTFSTLVSLLASFLVVLRAIMSG